MADSIFAPATDDQEPVDPRLIKGALAQNKDSIFGPGYTATATPAASPASPASPGGSGDGSPSIYGASTVPQGPVKSPAAESGSEMIPFSDPVGEYVKNNPRPQPRANQFFTQRAQKHEMQDWQAGLEAAKEQAATRTAYASAQATGEYRRSLAGLNAERATHPENFYVGSRNPNEAALVSDPNADPDIKAAILAKWGRGSGSGKTQTFVSHTPEGDVLFEKDPKTGKYRQAETEGGTSLVKPPPAPNFQAIPTNQGLTPFDSRTGKTGQPDPNLNRVVPEPSPTAKTLSAVDVQNIHDKIQSEIDHRYPIVDAQGHRTDDVAALRLQNQREREAGIAPGMKPAAASAAPPVSLGTVPGHATPELAQGPPPAPRNPRTMDTSSLRTPVPPAAVVKQGVSKSGKPIVYYSDGRVEYAQ